MTLAIIDDHKLLGQTLKLLIENNLDKTEIRVFSEPKVFLTESFTDWVPDLVIVDFFMPGMNAIEMITSVQPRLPEARYIILTSLSDTAMIREAFRIGISGYVTKDAADVELIEAIETVMTGGRYVNQSMKDKLVNNIFSDQNEEYRLSPREEEVLKKICSGNTPKEIANQMGLSINTVQEFTKRMMKKMKVNRTTDLVVLAIKTGLYVP